MTAPAWTTDAPTVAGLWIVNSDDDPDPSFLDIVMKDGVPLVLGCEGFERVDELYLDCEWLGPISPERIVRMDAALRATAIGDANCVELARAALDDAKVPQESPNSPTGQG